MSWSVNARGEKGAVSVAIRSQALSITLKGVEEELFQETMVLINESIDAQKDGSEISVSASGHAVHTGQEVTGQNVRMSVDVVGG